MIDSTSIELKVGQTTTLLDVIEDSDLGQTVSLNLGRPAAGCTWRVEWFEDQDMLTEGLQHTCQYVGRRLSVRASAVKGEGRLLRLAQFVTSYKQLKQFTVNPLKRTAATGMAIVRLVKAFRIEEPSLIEAKTEAQIRSARIGSIKTIAIALGMIIVFSAALILQQESTPLTLLLFPAIAIYGLQLYIGLRNLTKSFRGGTRG